MGKAGRRKKQRQKERRAAARQHQTVEQYRATKGTDRDR